MSAVRDALGRGATPRPEMRIQTGDLPDPSVLPDDVPNSRGLGWRFPLRLLRSFAAMGFRNSGLPVGTGSIEISRNIPEGVEAMPRKIIGRRVPIARRRDAGARRADRGSLAAGSNSAAGCPGCGDDGIGEHIGKLFDHPFDLLLGRRTYDIFAAYWPFQSPATDPIAEAFAECGKFVLTHSERTARMAGQPSARRSGRARRAESARTGPIW